MELEFFHESSEAAQKLHALIEVHSKKNRSIWSDLQFLSKD
jgi:hypothetical protein